MSSLTCLHSVLVSHTSSSPEVTPSSFIPGARITKYLGRVNLHLIKEKILVRCDLLSLSSSLLL